jgi:hypothetical protein
LGPRRSGFSASNPLAAPIGQSRRIEAFATQDGGDPARISGAVGLLQDAQLGRRGESPALGPAKN